MSPTTPACQKSIWRPTRRSTRGRATSTPVVATERRKAPFSFTAGTLASTPLPPASTARGRGPDQHGAGRASCRHSLAERVGQRSNPCWDQIAAILGDLSNGLASLAQSLHQIGDFHDGPATKRSWVDGDVRAGRAASYQVAWDLHRAAEMAHQVAGVIDRAHEVEATIAYDIHDFPNLAAAPRPSHEPGLSL